MEIYAAKNSPGRLGNILERGVWDLWESMLLNAE